jgi:hypothetical protein
MQKNLKQFSRITGGHNKCWNVHDGILGDLEGVIGSLENIYGDTTYCWGDFSGLIGDVSGLQNKVSRISGKINITGKVNKIYGCISGHGKRELYGDVTNLMGCITGIYGCCTGKRGNLDACGITPEDRERGVDIEDLVGE